MSMKRKRFLPWFMGPFVLAAAVAAGETGRAASFKVKVTAEIANIRLKPSIGSIIVRQIPQGEILEATEKEGQWFRVKLEPDESGTTSGYVHESLVLPLEEIPTAEVKPQVVEKPIEKPAEKPAEKPPDKPAEKPPVKEPEPPVRTELPEERPAARGRVFLSFFAGAGYALIGDLNSGAQGLADLYSSQLGIAPSQDVSPVHNGLLYGGEIGIPLSARVFLTLGAERLAGGAESEILFNRAGGLADAFMAHPEFKVLPVRAAIMVYPADFLFLRFGLSYNFASCAYAYKFEREATWQEWSGEAKARGIGLLGGIGLEWRFGRNFALVGEVSGQYVPISGFEGTGTYQDETLSVPATEEGTLYAFDAKSGLTSYALLYIRDKLPSEAGVENAREAKIDFSGFALRLGLKITF